MIITLRWMQDWMDTISAPHGGGGAYRSGTFPENIFFGFYSDAELTLRL